MSDKFLKTYEEVKAWLEQMNIRDYSIDKNLLVDVHESVDISNKNLSYLPLQFSHIKGDFFCNANNLTGLTGAPEIVEGSFQVMRNNLKSLEGGPRLVQGSYACTNNSLTDLKGAPEQVNSYFYCVANELTKLSITTKIGKSLLCYDNNFDNMENLLNWSWESFDIKEDVYFSYSDIHWKNPSLEKHGIIDEVNATFSIPLSELKRLRALMLLNQKLHNLPEKKAAIKRKI